MSDTFSLDSYESEHDDVDEYLEREDTPIDHKKSPADGAIEHRQKAKSGEKPTKEQHDMSHISIADDSSGSVTQEVHENRHGKAHTQVEEPEKAPDDPAEW